MSDTFQQLLLSQSLPPIGTEEYYFARRKLWLTPLDPSSPPKPQLPSSSRQRLEDVLNAPNATSDNAVWEGCIKKVWQGLSAGVKLKKRLPMRLVVKIIYCAWLRDQTWPTGGIAPDDDMTLPPSEPSQHVTTTNVLWIPNEHLRSSISGPPAMGEPSESFPSPSTNSSGRNTPWLLVDHSDIGGEGALSLPDGHGEAVPSGIVVNEE